ncbi:LysR family transcriptional regulator [Shewanella aquimarina]|uniref:LysR family transcriptional regulator n=1 Tax=Shewanella aquimarina TaxID=260365 RepID=UPI0020149E33|nr:LysR family transcriptional regulator [Shewanella aquimarina]MCL2909065.1 LysR family transcriptional regulator [Shewanella aquimarina]
MPKDKLLDISLSTIEIFCQVYVKKNAIEVANHLDLSQPKVSRALAALRNVFDDPLFIRRESQFQATDRAHDLYPLFNEMLACRQQVDLLMRGVTGVVHDHVEIATVPQLEVNLTQSVKQAAYRVFDSELMVSTSPWGELTQQQLLNDEIAAAICFERANDRAILSKSVIQHRGGYLVAREDHPIWSAPNVDNMINYPLVKLRTMPFPANKSPLGNYAKRVGKQLEIYATAPDLGSAANSLLNSDAIIIIGVKGAVNFLRNIKGLRAQQIELVQDNIILENFSHPTVYLWLRLDASGKVTTPFWLQHCLEDYILSMHQ